MKNQGTERKSLDVRSINTLHIPEPVLFIINRLEEHGYSAYIVGGCVRDAFLGKEPHDWDVTTSASPNELEEVFKDQDVDKSGFGVGVLIVILNGVKYEVASFREDGPYEDHRHPSWTRFVDEIEKDLIRRDFTFNGMAYSPSRGFVDLFGGLKDLQAGILRCIGNSETRFNEDAFRMLRAIRFASTFNYSLSPDTEAAIHKLAPLLSLISADRFCSELLKMLVGSGAGRLLREYNDILAEFIPELKQMVGFEQNNKHHRFTLWEHTVRSIESAPADPLIRLAMLFHDVGKPMTKVTDNKGESHYRGHPDKSALVAEQFLSGRNDAPSLDKESKKFVIALIKYHDIDLGLDEASGTVNPALMAKRLRQFSEEYRDMPEDFSARLLKALIYVHMADRTATGTRTDDQIEKWKSALLEAYESIISSNAALSRKDLAINGGDLIKMGLRGKSVGETLDKLLDLVIEGRIENTKDALLGEVTKSR